MSGPRARGRTDRRAAAALLAVWLCPGGQAAAREADASFARTRVEPVPAAIVANEPFRTGFVVANDGEATQYTRIVFDVPTDVLLAEPVDGCVGEFDPVERRVVFEGGLPAGWTGSCTLTLVAIPGRSNVASLAVRVETPPDRYAGDVRQVDIVTPPAPAAARVGGFGITAAGLAVLVWLATLVVSVALARRAAGRDRRGAGGSVVRRATRGRGLVQGTIAIMIAVGFLAYFAWMAWDDWRVLNAFTTTTCEVLDASVSAQSQSSTSGTRVMNTSYSPNFSLRYRTSAGTMTSVGFSTASRLQYHAADVAAFVDAVRSRQSVPCRYDPRDPGRVVLLAGFGGAYLFALLPLLLIAWGVFLLRA